MDIPPDDLAAIDQAIEQGVEKLFGCDVMANGKAGRRRILREAITLGYELGKARRDAEADRRVGPDWRGIFYEDD